MGNAGGERGRATGPKPKPGGFRAIAPAVPTLPVPQPLCPFARLFHSKTQGGSAQPTFPLHPWWCCPWRSCESLCLLARTWWHMAIPKQKGPGPFGPVSFASC